MPRESHSITTTRSLFWRFSKKKTCPCFSSRENSKRLPMSWLLKKPKMGNWYCSYILPDCRIETTLNSKWNVDLLKREGWKSAHTKTNEKIWKKKKKKRKKPRVIGHGPHVGFWWSFRVDEHPGGIRINHIGSESNSQEVSETKRFRHRKLWWSFFFFLCGSFWLCTTAHGRIRFRRNSRVSYCATFLQKMVRREYVKEGKDFLSYGSRSIGNVGSIQRQGYLNVVGRESFLRLSFILFEKLFPLLSLFRPGAGDGGGWDYSTFQQSEGFGVDGMKWRIYRKTGEWKGVGREEIKTTDQRGKRGRANSD